MRTVNKGTSAVLPFEITDPSGALTNSTGLPTIVRIMLNGVMTTVAGATVEQQQDTSGATPTPIVGRYQIKVPTSTFVANDQIQVHLQSTINGSTEVGDLMFSITDVQAGRPKIVTYD